MNTLDTLYFPGTDIHSVRQYPLFLMFQKVHLITPVEGDPVEGGKESPDSFIKSGFCQVHTPCPLGADRHRFLRLVEDLKNRKDDYAAQLSSLTLAAMTTNGKAEDSERAIIKSLLGEAAEPAQDQDREQAEQLWQARLVLAIGELLDHEEEEIAMHLAMLEEEEKGLFQELQGDDDSPDEENPFAELNLMKSKLHGSHAGNGKKRFQAWRTLFSAAAMADCPVFLTGSPDGGDLLLELFESMAGRPAPPPAELPLPAFVGWNSVEAGQAVREFAEKHRGLLTRLETVLRAIAAGEAPGEKELEALQELAAPWKEALNDDFPAERFGRIPVRIHVLPGSACSTLVDKIQPTPASGPANGILAVVG